MKKCAKCKRAGELHHVANPDDIMKSVLLCQLCLRTVVWHWVDANPSAPTEVRRSTTKSLERLFKL